MWSRWRNGIPPDPDPADLPSTSPDIVQPRAAAGEVRATWVGHATVLLQIGGANLLTDPHFSRRAAPVQWMGPARFTSPGISIGDLPPIDAVVLSHDHYDHLDRGSVRALRESMGDGVRWFAPLGYRQWLAGRGVTNLVELDWWEEASFVDPGGSRITVTAAPAQHWTRRGLADSERLWASWTIESDSGGRVYFGGDSGYFDGFAEIGRRLGPFDLALLPIGAYDPRWFMKPDHMNPEEAVQAFLDLGGAGDFGAIHWGTFRLTDEDPLEPPVRVRRAWTAAGLEPGRLWVPRHGETRRLRGMT